MTKGLGKLDINIDSTVGTARKLNKRGRPRKEVTSQETRKKANTRERRRMSELTKIFDDLRKILPAKDHLKTKKEILVMVKMQCNHILIENNTKLFTLILFQFQARKHIEELSYKNIEELIYNNNANC